MLSFEYEEDGTNDPNIAMDVDSDDLDDAQGDIDIDADGVVDFEQDVPQQYSSPYEAQVASTSRITVSADLNPPSPRIYIWQHYQARPTDEDSVRHSTRFASNTHSFSLGIRG